MMSILGCIHYVVLIVGFRIANLIHIMKALERMATSDL
jgi:hypothetical protein